MTTPSFLPPLTLFVQNTSSPRVWRKRGGYEGAEEETGSVGNLCQAGPLAPQRGLRPSPGPTPTQQHLGPHLHTNNTVNRLYVSPAWCVRSPKSLVG